MGRFLTSAELTAIAEGLRTMMGAVSDQEGATGEVLTAAAIQFDRISGAAGGTVLWKGPRADQTLAAGRDYVAEVAGASAAMTEGVGVLRRWADRADEIAGYVQAHEATQAQAAAERAAGEIDDETANADWRASNAIMALTADWEYACTTFSAEVASWMPGLETACGAVPESFPSPVLQGLQYYALLAGYADDHDLDFDEVDPTGKLALAVDELINEFDSTPDGALVWLFIETAGEGDLTKGDGEGTNGDLTAAMDPETALGQIEQYEQRTGTQFDEETKRRLVEQVVAGATLLHASGRADDEPLGIDNSIPPPTPTSPDDPRYQGLILNLSEGTRGYLVTEVATAITDQWQSMVDRESQIVDGQAVIYFDVPPVPGSGVVVVDFFIPSTISGPLAGDSRDFVDPVFGDIGPHDSRVVLVMDLEQGRASIHVDDTELFTYHLGQTDAHHVELDNDSNAWDETMTPDGDVDVQVGPDFGNIVNTASVDVFLNQVTVGYDMVNSITPLASTDGTFTIQLAENGTFEVTDFNADEYPSIGIYQYQPAPDGEGIVTTTVIERESRGVMYTFPFWNDTVAAPFESVIRPINGGIQSGNFVYDHYFVHDQMAPGVYDPLAPGSTEVV